MDTVGHNKIAINFVWTLLAGFLVMFMQAGFAMVETGFTRAKNAAHTMSDELHGLPDRHARLLDLRVRAADGRRRRGRRPRRHAAAQSRVHGQPVRAPLRPVRPERILPERQYLRRRRLRAVPVPDGVHGHRRRRFRPARWPNGGSSPRSSSSGSSCRWSCIRSLPTGCGAAAGSRSSARSSVSGTGTSTSPDRRSSTWWAASPRWPARSSSARASASTRRTANRCRCLDTISRWRSPAPSSSRSAGSGSTPARRWRAAICASRVVATNTMLAGAGGAIAAMFYVWKRLGKPDPSMLANGMLAGLVAITAPCAFVNSVSAVVIGAIAGILVVESVLFIDRVAEDRRSRRRDFRARRQRRLGRAVAGPLRRRRLRRRVERSARHGQGPVLRRRLPVRCAVPSAR